MTNNTIPKMMTIPEIARTGLLPEHALRVMVKRGEIPAVYSGAKAFINYDNLVAKLSQMGAVEPPKNVINIVEMRSPDFEKHRFGGYRYNAMGGN
jgi:hypothetical protein